MSSVPVGPDNSIPLIVGYQYRLKGAGDNWVEIVAMSLTKVTVHGIYPTIMEKVMRKDQFDDILTGEFVIPDFEDD
jgi:hypothetical protein